ncbi:spore germination protein KC [Paenibacillus phyllosphaerae]|uniref:Spore germination protein KC n=1 Tax=Paenibacillus phyllosphaerae TaxID=274593 RepID=A0A7W5FQF3_9BACL|nr:Ger(x)C family spore germination protein [Paenibacillus phyllosphaerae]MBB3112979.1 spore germination protein KC [Paenibacillus phyllosphaerae]
MKPLLLLRISALLLLVLLAGCWSRRELNTLAIQLGMGIDKSGDDYSMTVQVVDPSKVASRAGGSEGTPVALFEAKGMTVHEAARKMTETSPRRIYGAHIRVFVLGEELAREGIAKALDLQYRDSEERTDFLILIAKGGKAKDVLNVMTQLEKIPATKLYNSLIASSRAWAPSTMITLDQLVTALTADGTNPVITGVRVIGGKAESGGGMDNISKIEAPVKLKLAGLAVFRGDKLIGWLNEEESRGYNYITGNIKSSVGNLACPDGGRIALEVVRSDTKMKGKVENGKPVIDLALSYRLNVSDVECKINLEDPAVIKQLEDLSEARLLSLLKKTVDVMQHKFGVDNFGFSQAIYRADPKAWDRMKDQWDDLFPDLEVRYQVKAKIRWTSTAKNSFINDIKE